MRVSFRTILIGCLIMFLVGTVSVVGIVSYLSSKRSAEQMSGQIIEQVEQRIDKEIRSLLDVAVTQSQLAERTIDPADMTQLAAYFYDAMSVQPQLSYLSFARESDGAYCHAYRDPSGKLTIRQLVREPDGRLSLTDYERRGTELVQVRHEADKPENDARKRPYYQAVVAHDAPQWTETYVFIGASGELDVPGVTYATPIKRGGVRVGVMTADFDLRALSQFLQSIRVLDNGFAFVVEHRADKTDRLIAHPNLRVLTASEADGERQTVSPDKSNDRRIADLFASVRFPLPVNAPPTTYETAGESYVGALRPLDKPDVKWSIGVIVPEADILGEVNANIRFQAIVGVVAVIIAIFLALFVAALVARPLRAIASEAEAIGKFQLDPSPKEGRVTEVHMLGVAVEDMKMSLRSFKKFVPSDIVRQLVVTGKEAMRGGERKTLTIFFSDLEGFTSISEQLQPETLVKLLGEYLEAMTDQILDSDGTVDKYIGDAIMAFWNAPAEHEDHALRACTIALSNQRKLAELRESWAARGLPQFKVRIGLNTGDAIVGNIGSANRLDYTAIGDSVNLASRLEGLNKYFGTSIIISSSTYALVADKVVVRPLDKVSVKGKAQSAMVYELLALTKDATKEQRELADTHRAGLDAYFARDWDTATSLFEKVRVLEPDDVAAEVLIQRCAALRAEPPAADWDGVYRLYRK